MSAVKGKDVVMYVDDAALGNILFACGTDCSVNIRREFKEVTNYTSGAKEFRPSLLSWEMNATGLIISNNQYGYTRIIRDQLAGLKIFVTFTVNDGGNYYNFSGFAFIQNTTITGTNKSIATYSCAMLGTGNPSISSTIPPTPELLPMERHEFGLVAEGTTFVTASELVGAKIIGLFRGGPEVMTIITVGSPGPTEVKSTPALGRLDFGQPIYPGGELITAQYRPV